MNPERTTIRRRWGLGLFGVVLGISLGTMVIGLPNSPSAARVQSLWQPALQTVHRGVDALKRGDEQTSGRYFDDAVRSASHSGKEREILRAIVEECVAHQAWKIGLKYGQRTMAANPSTLDRVRYGELLMGLHQPAKAETFFDGVVSGKTPDQSSRADRMIYDLAVRDLVCALISQQKGLARSCKLAEDGIRRELGPEGSRSLLALLDDALSWLYFKQAVSVGKIRDLELSRVYVENGLDNVPWGADPTITSTLYFHASRIYAAEGRKLDAARASELAWKASTGTVRTLVEDEQSGRKNQQVSASALLPLGPNFAIS